MFLVEGRVYVVPHDLLKVCHWTSHCDTALLPNILEGSKVWNAVKDHHRKRWHSDALAAAIARQFFDGDEFVTGDLDAGVHYFIPVYEPQNCVGGFIELPFNYREKLYRQIKMVYEEEHGRGGDWEARANERVNELLLYFPADTWAPFVSLAAHHVVTWILHLQDEGNLKSAVRDEGGVRKTEVCILIFRVPETEFYKLKEIRRFYAKRESTLEKIQSLLYHDLQRSCGVGLSSIRIGDELVTVTVDRNVKGVSLVEGVILKTVCESGLQCIVKLIRVPVSQELSETRRERCWGVAASPSEDEYAVGVSLEEKGFGKADWEPHLRKRFVGWFLIKPESLTDCCRYFVENHVLKVMERLRESKKCKPGKKPPALRLEASPDLMFSVVMGYQAFLNDVMSCLHPKSSVVRGFSQSLFVIGANGYRKFFSSYESLLNLCSRLHIPVKLAAVVTDPKFPFWKVLEIFKEYPDALTIMPRSGVALSLNKKDFELMQVIIPVVSRIKRTVWMNEIVPVSARTLEELDFELRRLAFGAKHKLTEEDMARILEFAKRLDENHAGEGEERKRGIRYAAFKRLGDFAGVSGGKMRKF